MANYNSGKIYNRKMIDGGANYNSGPFVIVVIDNGKGIDEINSLSASVTVADSSSGTDSTSIAGAFFVVDSNSVLQPLGVKVLGDSRYELMPATRDITDEIPGMHGELDFGSEFKARNLELHVVTNNDYTPLEKAQLQRLFAKYLDPTKGVKSLIFSDDVEKTYMVKFSGKIDPTMYATWFEFTLPFKMSNPIIKGSFKKTLTGSGTITNVGNFETPLTIEISGPSLSSSIQIGTNVFTYTGTIPSGQKLIIDTGASTVMLNGLNALGNFIGELPLFLEPGNTNVIANSDVMFKWYDSWL